jgi:DNA-directed RNA polymerase specialized sigma24 family protein
MFIRNFDKCIKFYLLLDKDIFQTKLAEMYPRLLKRAVGLKRSQTKGMELLHDVISKSVATDEKITAMNDIATNGNLEGYMCRAIYLSSMKKPKQTEELKDEHDNHNRHWDDNLESKLSNRIANETIDLLINRMNSFDAELIQLWMLPGFSYDDAESITGISKVKLQQNITRSLKRLKIYVQRTSGNKTSTANDL